MVATKGRASYFNEASKGYIDPGAQSSVYIQCNYRRRVSHDIYSSKS